MIELPDERFDAALEHLKEWKKELLQELHKIEECIRVVEENRKI